jgi:hypothetical protein
MLVLLAAVMAVMLVIVTVLLVRVRGLRRFRLGLVFEGVGGTQRFAFQAHWTPFKLPLGADFRPQAALCGVQAADCF